MIDKREFDEFAGEISYLNESTKDLIKQIKEADKMSVNLKYLLDKLETVSKSLNLHIVEALNDNIEIQLKAVVEENLKDFLSKSKKLNDLSIHISQSVDFINNASKKIEKRQKYHIIEVLFYLIFFGAGLFMQSIFHILHLR